MFIKYTGDGNGLERGSKFLGHRTPITTFRYYYHPDQEGMVADLPFFQPQPAATTMTTPPGGASDSTTALYEWERQRRVELEQQLQCMWGILTEEQRQRMIEADITI